MNLRLLACLACSAAFLLSACSGNNPAGTSSGGSGNGTGGSNGNGNGDANGGPVATALGLADERRADALEAVRKATAAANAAAAGTGDRASASNLISAAHKAIDAAVRAAEDAVKAAADGGTQEEIGRADVAKYNADTLKTQQTGILNTAQASFAWYGNTLARAAIPNGDVDIPADGTNKAMIVTRTPRTIRTSATDSTQKANPDAITSTTFKYVMYSDGKVLLSGGGRTTSPGVTEDEFKVDGDVVGMTPTLPLDTDTHTQLTLTNTGLTVRVGGTRSSGSDAEMTDYTDMRKDITAGVDDADADGTADTPNGQNAWDLTITFDEPRSLPVQCGEESCRTSWQGNGDYYWRGIVRADDSQLESSGANYESDAFKQPKEPVDQRDLGTYEVWLSNHAHLDKRVEPTDPNDPPHTIDDVNRYLNYAAYGLFIYTADPETFRATTNGHENRVQSLSFGYQAFASEDGKRTRDISKAIDGTFVGQTLATIITGTQSAGTQKATLLRGKASLTVTIPKDSDTAGKVSGTLSGFEEWAGTYWKEYKPNTAGDFSIRLDSGTAGTGADISASGSYNGVATATNAATGLGGDEAADGVGKFKGNFYGPRTGTDLETAGSWNVGPQAGGQADSDATSIIVGSFGAKQNPPPASN